MSERSPLREVPRSVEEQVYELLRERIVRAEYEPGTKFVLAQLAEEVGVSTMPIRAALKRLEGDGLVTYAANKGATVMPLDAAHFQEIQEIRIVIESHAAQLGAVAVTEGDLERMRNYRDHMIASDGSLDDLLSWEWNGYMTCYRASGRRHLVAVIRDHGRLAERYTRQATGGRFEPAAVASYERFLDACTRRDPEAAAAAAREGLERHLHAIIRQMGEANTTGRADEKHD